MFYIKLSYSLIMSNTIQVELTKTEIEEVIRAVESEISRNLPAILVTLENAKAKLEAAKDGAK